MKLMSLNTWGGRMYEPLISFLQKYRGDVDMFCFQEVNNCPLPTEQIDPGSRENFYRELEVVLPEHVGYFAPQVPGIGVAMFIRKEKRVARTDYSIVLSANELKGALFPRPLQWASFVRPALSVYNFHGVPKSEKRDTPERDIQTNRVLEILEKDSNPKVLVGDFNLRPDTNSIRAFEKNMKNLVIEKGFSTTRSQLYKGISDLPFADYIFVSNEVTVNDFTVLQDEISDHLPLLLDFDLPDSF